MGVTANQFLNLEGNVDLPMDLGVTAYTGLGYRFWERDLLGDGGYREIYHWFYVPIGARYTLPLSSNVDVTLDGTLKIMFAGSMTAYLAFNPDFALGSRLGYKIQAPIDIKTGDHITFNIVSWLEYSSIGKSNIVVFREDDGTYGGFQEPNSRTYQYGMNIGITTTL